MYTIGMNERTTEGRIDKRHGPPTRLWPSTVNKLREISKSIEVPMVQIADWMIRDIYQDWKGMKEKDRLKMFSCRGATKRSERK